MSINAPMTSMIPPLTGQQQIPIQIGIQNQRWMSPSKQQYG